MFFSNVLKPVLPTIRINVTHLYAFWSKPVRALPTKLRTKTSTLLFKFSIYWRNQIRTPAFVFFMRPAEGVVFSVKFKCTIANPIFVSVNVAETANVYHPQIHWWLSAQNPFCECFSRPPGSCNPKGIETGTDKIIIDFRCFT